MVPLTVVLTNFNEATNLRGALESVKFADEVVLVDGGSTDDSISVAKEFGARVFVRRNSRQLNVNKNFGLDQSRSDWILVLDTDERIPAPLALEIEHQIGEGSCDGYYITRRNYFGTRWLAHGGWYPDRVLRLFRRGKGRFECKHVHETLAFTGGVNYLEHEMDHLTYRNFSEYLRKFLRYTAFEANVFPHFGAKRKYPFLRFLAVEPVRIFLNTFILKAGYLDGGEGLIVYFFSAMYPAIYYLRYRLKV